MKKIFVILVAVALMLSLIPATAALASGDNGYCDSAVNDPPITVGADWSATTDVPPAFFWGSGTPAPSDSDPFTFSCTDGVRVDVTDDFDKGDQFRVYDWGSPIGDTSFVAAVEATEVGPEAAFNDPTYSSGSFYLVPGDHSIEIEAITNPWGGGRGYIRVMPVDGPLVVEKHLNDWLQGGDGDNIIEVGEKWHFALEIEVFNVSDSTIENIVVKDHFGADLELGYVDQTQGTFTSTTNRGKSAQPRITWDLGDLESGGHAAMAINVSPDTNPGGNQEFTSPCEHFLNSGATAKGIVEGQKKDHKTSASSDPVAVYVFYDLEGEWEGTIEQTLPSPDGPYELYMEIETQDGEPQSDTCTIEGEGTVESLGFDFEGIYVCDGVVEIEVDGSTLTGTVSEDGQTISGTWAEDGYSGTFSLTRV